ncbi:Mitochondrial inner membrane protease atp23 [Chytridiales sp. JEL 0842]|nr:Mitochondrial inner membrane protease atp23 [Chytridiales sp. JEL 0842]
MLDDQTAQRWKNEVLTQNKKVVELMTILAKSGCPLPPSQIQIVKCSAEGNQISNNPTNQQGSAHVAAHGGFRPDVGIRICQEHIPFKLILQDTITHELIHVYDWCTKTWDPLNLRHQACSEVRAAGLSGECGVLRELARGKFGDLLSFTGFEACVKRRAALSVSAHPSCRDFDHAKAVVDEVYPTCSKDHSPFSEEALVS